MLYEESLVGELFERTPGKKDSVLLAQSPRWLQQKHSGRVRVKLYFNECGPLPWNRSIAGSLSLNKKPLRLRTQKQQIRVFTLGILLPG